MPEAPKIYCEYSGPPEPFHEKSFLTFYEDDYLIRFDREGDTASLWCFTRYGSQLIEINFAGVTDVKVENNLNESAPWDGYGYKIKRNPDGLLTVTFDNSELLKITFHEAWIKPCSLIQIGERQYREEKSQGDIELKPKYMLGTLGIGTALYLLYKYWRA